MLKLLLRVKKKLRIWLVASPSELAPTAAVEPPRIAPYLHEETAETYRARLVAGIIADDAAAAAAHDLIGAVIARLPDQTDQEHSALHVVRHLLTYSMVPAGPGRIADIGGPSLAQHPLSELKHWDVETVPILSTDFETATFPYGDGSLDGVLLCEVLEHFINDPLHCLIELNRILKPGGFLLITTPNAASWFAIYQALHQRHPNRWPVYGGPDPERHHHIHAREYLVSELIQLVTAAGFIPKSITTLDYGINAQHRPIPGFSIENRGETIFCCAIKTGAPLYRQVAPLYLESIPFHG